MQNCALVQAACGWEDQINEEIERKHKVSKARAGAGKRIRGD